MIPTCAYTTSTGTAAVTLAELPFQNQKPVVHREPFA
jgi:hypothetical protein